MITPAKSGRNLTPISMLVLSAKQQSGASRQRRQVVGCRRHQSTCRRYQPSPSSNFSERFTASKSPHASCDGPYRNAIVRAVAIHDPNPVSTGNPAARHSGNPSSSRRTLNP
jgi:hypothetical protein